jgi:LmbE family N-acetylglucosaminyl deacetylase
MAQKSVIAIGAHPDDIEFCMAGTLLQLRAVGWKIHYFNVSSGNLGSVTMTSAKTVQIRAKEARAAARILKSRYHASVCQDLEIMYDIPTLRKVAGVIRKSRASIVLTHSPVDYMEDHTNTCRLAVTAAFAHGMPSFKTSPTTRPYGHDVAVYHAMPHSLQGPLREKIVPGSFVDTTNVHEVKIEALGAHASQQDWLDASQGMNSYLKTADDMSRHVGKLSKKFRHAEAWRRHLYYGFSRTEVDPLSTALGKLHKINAAYERMIKKGT